MSLILDNKGNVRVTGTATNPAGADTEIQFNDGGAFGADSDLTWTKATNVLAIGGTNGIDINPGSDADADLLMVGVTGSPKLWWDESLDAFGITNGFRLSSSDTYPMVISGSNATWVGFQQRATISGAKPYIEWFNQADGEQAWIELDPTNQLLRFSYVGVGTLVTIEKTGDVVVGSVSAAAQLHVDQPSLTGAQPVLLLDQADISEEFLNFTISGDQDMVLAKLSVTGNPTINWDESEDSFSLTNGLRVVSGATYPMIVQGSNGAWVGFQQRATVATAKPYIEWFNQADNEQAWIELDPTNQRLNFVYVGTGLIVTFEKGGDVGIGIQAPTAQLHVDQSSLTGAQPVLLLDQADLSEEFIDFVSTIGAGNPIDTAAIGTYYGKARVAVNGTFKYVALYNS